MGIEKKKIFSELNMDVIGANLDRIKTPGSNDRVYKDECFYSFDSPVRISLVLFHILILAPGKSNRIIHLHEPLAGGGKGLS